ncbi:dienelactone hydrolase family protein [Rhizorhabdus histidinilytica]|uniref:dienelactone hydrolase family protein n=1 Tax=Rhizorhabdus histidinilytica TaxID=439228 RepID=UPI001ADABE44|nr:dienelactone hydrolase family protein [Rhizorhabdus histidinilytica]
MNEGLPSLAFGDEGERIRIAILPDIYGPGPFYQQLATHLAERGAFVHLMDPFHDLGPLPEITREAAFARRHRVRDRAYVDAFAHFIGEQRITGVVGFCLGGLYVFELARRGIAVDLVSLYGFPQGLANDDPLPIPFDYLDGLPHRHVALFGDQDQSQSPENFLRLEGIAERTPGFGLHLFPGSGHGFLADIGSDDPTLAQNARAALEILEEMLLVGEAKESV